MNNVDGQVSLFGQDGCAGRTSRECLAQDWAKTRPKERISGSFWRKSFGLKAIPFMSLDLTPGSGNLLGEYYWEIRSPLLGGCSMLNTGPAPLREEDVFTLSQILEEHPPRKYYLSKKACRGILRRSHQRGKPLPKTLKIALMAQAGLIRVTGSLDISMLAFHMNQRDEAIDLGETAGALMATSNMQMQTFVTAGFCAGASPSAGSIGYHEEVAPTLKASDSGTNMVPSVLCLNDQGGKVMECSEDISGTLRAQEHGHQPLVYECHGIDGRYTGPHKVVPTLSAVAGTGGNNLPLVEQKEPVFCIPGNIIDRQPQTGGNGTGVQEDIAYTLTATDRHAVFARQRCDKFREGDVASTESARQHKDASDLVYQETTGTLTSSDSKGPNNQYVSQDKLIVEGLFLIRRLTVRECERLQGYPDDWTLLPGAADGPRYRALGNSVAISCVNYIMKRIAWAYEAHF